MKTTVAKYIATYVKEKCSNTIFSLVGGGSMYLNDAFHYEPELNVIYNHHEQACAMAAVGYAKYTNKIGVACITTGCGGTNAMTGLLDAWQDSARCLFISGQVNTKDIIAAQDNLALRQVGVQEADIISLVKPITKYACTVTKAENIAYELDYAIDMMNDGRPGPVWLDIPLDIQKSIIDTKELRRFLNPAPQHLHSSETDHIPEEIKYVIEEIGNAKRPIVLFGNGVRLSDTQKQLNNFIDKLNIPAVTSYLGLDLMSCNDSHYLGRLGVKGNRAANFAVQNSDLVIVLGNRLALPMIGFDGSRFAREAKIIVVDIDKVEHSKNTIRIDKFIECDLRDFFNDFEKYSWKYNIPTGNGWTEQCKEWKNMWTIWQSNISTKSRIDIYTFINELSKNLQVNESVVSSTGSEYYATSQGLKLHKNNRYITSGAQADMGFAIPASIGVAVASDNIVFAIDGDGSFQLNIQELQTIKHYSFPIKLMVINNGGYGTIHNTNENFFKRYSGVNEESGISFPSLKKIAAAYGIKYFKISKVDNIQKQLNAIRDYNGPVICEIIAIENQNITPISFAKTLKSGKIVAQPLENMFPCLSKKILEDNMIIEYQEEE